MLREVYLGRNTGILRFAQSAISLYDTPENENYAEAGACLGCVPKYRRIFQGRMTGEESGMTGRGDFRGAEKNSDQ